MDIVPRFGVRVRNRKCINIENVASTKKTFMVTVREWDSASNKVALPTICVVVLNRKHQ